MNTEAEIQAIRQARMILIRAYNNVGDCSGPASRKLARAWTYLDAEYIHPYEAALLADEVTA